MRERILEATYDCVSRYGLAKTTVEDVARQAGLSRATVYRHVPGGRDELIRDVITWETDRFFQRLAAAVAGTTDLQSLCVEALVFAHRSVEEHVVLQKILQTEPEVLLPQLTVESFRIMAGIRLFLLPFLESERAAGRLADGLDLEEAADYMGRMFLSFVSAQGRWDLTDRDQVDELVRTEVLGGILR